MGTVIIMPLSIWTQTVVIIFMQCSLAQRIIPLHIIEGLVI